MFTLPKKFQKTNPNVYNILIQVGAFLLVIFLTYFVYLSRAGADLQSNWPVSFNLSTSDNGILFQFADDVFKQRSLGWQFSGQVFVFPEIPISLLSYLLAKANVYYYYLIVACINTGLLFASILAFVKCQFRHISIWGQTSRSLLGVSGLLIVPLFGNTTFGLYHLLPTYYIGTYLVIFWLPTIFLTRSKSLKVVLSIFSILSLAANPMGLVFCFPALFLCAILLLFKNGFDKDLQKKVGLGTIIIVFVLAIRRLFFDNFTSTGIDNYISVEGFKNRISYLENAILFKFTSDFDKVFLNLILLLLALSIFFAVFRAREFFVQAKSRNSIIGLVYILILPFSALLSMHAILITNPMYMWPIIFVPGIAMLIQIPKIPRYVLILIISVTSLISLVSSGSINNFANANTNYFSYRSELTKCLDDQLTFQNNKEKIGYSTFSDGRKTSLTSTKNITLIHLINAKADTGWLTNNNYPKTLSGSFFIISSEWLEQQFDTKFIKATFGEPDKKIKCNSTFEIYEYLDSNKLSRISNYYKYNLVDIYFVALSVFENNSNVCSDSYLELNQQYNKTGFGKNLTFSKICGLESNYFFVDKSKNVDTDKYKTNNSSFPTISYEDDKILILSNKEINNLQLNQ